MIASIDYNATEDGCPCFLEDGCPCFLCLEVDYYWEKLSAGGDPKAQQCGWLKDQFGVSWQVAPTILSQMLQDTDAAKTERVMTAIFQMKKLDVAALQRAYEGG